MQATPLPAPSRYLKRSGPFQRQNNDDNYQQNQYNLQCSDILEFFSLDIQNLFSLFSWVICVGVCVGCVCTPHMQCKPLAPRTPPTHPCNGCIGTGVGRRVVSQIRTIQSAASWEYKYRPLFRVSDGWRRFCVARFSDGITRNV